jgi:hypothetical protein
MNASVEMPDHGELNTSHFSKHDYVFSGHFHHRQTKGNINYIGNPFGHNYADVWDFERGAMILEWDKDPVYNGWPGAPKYRVYNLSDVLDKPDELLLPNSYVKINLDIDISFEEASFIREKLIPEHHLRELTLIPIKRDFSESNSENNDSQFESVDTIIQTQIESLEEGSFDKKLLLDIYRNL